jgi:hypothetical protein
MAVETMAKFIAANTKAADKKDVAALKRMGFQELRALFTETAQQAIKENREIFGLLRQQLPVYPVS